MAAVGVEFIWPILIDEHSATFAGKIPLEHVKHP